MGRPTTFRSFHRTRARRALIRVIPPSQSIDPRLRTKRPLLTQPSNPVLSLSKHAWSPRPALRQTQGEVVVALALRRHRESVISLAGMRKDNHDQELRGNAIIFLAA